MRVRHSKPRALLQLLAAGAGVAVISVLSPRLPATLLRAYLRQRRFQKGRFLEDLRRLQARELIEFIENADGTIKITLKKRGKELVLRYKFDEIRIKKPPRWDGKWRLLIFDIPHAKKRARDALNRKLKEMEFYPLQKSVFLQPYPCEDEIDFIGQVFNVREHILLLTISDFEGSEKLRHHFGL